MRRVLIVTSSYAPAMIADMQRARHLAWELPHLGWEVEILSPSKEYQAPRCLDEDSAQMFSTNSQVHPVTAMWPDLFRIARVGTIGWSALLPMYLSGNRLLRRRKFDLIYITTAHYPLFLLGSLWSLQFALPYVLDLHDPVTKENGSHPVWAEPRLKHRLNSLLARRLEAQVAAGASGLVSVSPYYIESLRKRYETKKPQWLRPGRAEVIPFSALEKDFDRAVQSGAPRVQKNGPPYRIVYVGVGGPVMARSFTVCIRALSQLRQQSPGMCKGIRIELYGTMLGWKPGDRRHLAEIAAKFGVDDLVQEEPARVSYRRSIELLLESDGALILGVDNAGYMPSKLFSYALSGKPLLAILHRSGPAYEQFECTPELGHAIWMGENDDMPPEETAQVLKQFLCEVARRQEFDRRASVMPYLADAMARRHVDLFEACLASAS